jgi:hypothetical protein
VAFQGGENEGLYFRHSDHLGSTSVLSDADGLRVEGSEVVYAPFGSIGEELGGGAELPPLPSANARLKSTPRSCSVACMHSRDVGIWARRAL